MKKRTILGAGLLGALFGAVFSFGCRRDGIHFRIEAQVADSSALYYLTPVDDPGRYYLKRSSDRKGRLTFEGRLKEPVCAYLVSGLGEKVSLIFLEEGTIRINPMQDDSTRLVVTGTPSNDACKRYEEDIVEIFTRYSALKVVTEEDSRRLEKELDSVQRSFFDRNKDKILGVYLFTQQQMNSLSAKEMESEIAAFAPQMQAHPMMEKARIRLDSLKKTDKKDGMK